MEGIRVNDEDENTQGKKKRKKEREFFYENESHDHPAQRLEYLIIIFYNSNGLIVRSSI